MCRAIYREDNLTSNCIGMLYIHRYVLSMACTYFKGSVLLMQEVIPSKMYRKASQRKVKNEHKELAITGPCCSKDGYIFIA